MITEARFGRMWTAITRSGDAPRATAARTKSRALSESVAPRTSRATVVHPTNATTIDVTITRRPLIASPSLCA
jgi:hypothetical protein